MIGEVHVDWDSPNVIRTGESSFILFPPGSPVFVSTPLGDDWQEIGYITDEGVDTPFGRFDS